MVVVGLVGWRQLDRERFEARAGRHLRAWWQRWTVYAPRMPGWLRSCALTVPDRDPGITVQVNPFRRSAIRPKARPRPNDLPRVVAVRSGGSWDEVHVKLIPGLTPEDFDASARRLAVSRGVARCQIRELTPNRVSVDFMRRDLLTDVVPCADLTALAAVPGEQINLRKVWAGRTEYGTDWHVSLDGGHTLTAGSTGAGKNTITWSPLVSIAPAIRDGLVRVSGIDPKGMELAYGRRVFHRYAVTSRDALALLDDLVESMEARKVEFAGRVRTVPVSREHPRELLEFDEIGALFRYVGDRKTREQIVERVALLTTQGRALGFTVRGYVQEPTKDTVPVRELFPRRMCLRVPHKNHVAMALGDHAYDRGAWADRIGESTPGVGYLFGEGIREALRVRAGWVPDETIKALEAFVTGTADQPAVAGQLLALPAPAASPAGGVA
ncbi:DNA segregation ATPase FtsK/SpoIIIE, S-DNA-T family [Pseudonocardia thermophila]|uniref:DNA segregation ATPase FtsK/SpoIIIE, S-DNA-T family n=1 Tax=Pseudonocardia thermophila TaxID=1848 RepID=A0A1M6XC16_PSETH|nr:FtsK/SpoIIIE domain-containing protein [Pseudonocardia thermophila]SHL03491.1 DNA segregation ATPase FtsK/SpoIIIE, S-DNA-T family [Pseudonocardia thermophila]